MKHWNRFFSLSASLLFAATLAFAADEPVDEARKLEEMAKSAKTSAEHANVVKLYRQRAEEFEAKAEKHEKEAKRLASGPRMGIASKWPAMARTTWQRERQLAMEARRAARECYEIADRHVRHVIEKEFAE